MVFGNFILCVLGEQQPAGFQIDKGISAAVKDSTKLSMTKNVFDGQMENTITSEKDPNGFKRNSTDFWPSCGFFKQQACNFLVEKADMPEMTALYVNQAYLSYKDNKKIYYYEFFIIGQVTLRLDPPEDLKNYIHTKRE